MAHRTLLLLLTFVLWLPAHASGQKKEKLSLLIQNIYGPNGLVVSSEDVLPDGSTHSGHFNSAFQSEFTQFNIALAGQLTSLPLPSPASGFTYTFDPGTGTFRRSTQSFGPILADRAETIGRNKISFGYNYQFFSFDSLEGVELSAVPAVFTHDDFQLGGGRLDVVTTENSIDATVGQFTAFLTYGVTDRLDVALAIPVIRTRLTVVSNATIQRVGTPGNPRVHFFRDPIAPGEFGNQRQFVSSGAASGLGDLILRVKGTAIRRGTTGLALGLDYRIPTGDEKDLLGSGAQGLRPFAAASFIVGPVSPHVNVGYQWNGSSVLAGDLRAGRKEDLPDQFLYVVGADIGVNERLTLAVDFLGARVIDSPRLVRRTFTAGTGPASSVFPDIRFIRESFSQANGSVGLKANLAGSFLVNFNLRFKLDDSGLRDKISPLLGIEYSF